jgi:hypothetical protein
LRKGEETDELLAKKKKEILQRARLDEQMARRRTPKMKKKYRPASFWNPNIQYIMVVMAKGKKSCSGSSENSLPR